MGQHLRGWLGPAARAEIVRLQLEEGVSERAAAAALSVAAGTARRWKLRWLAASQADRRSGRWALDRPGCSRAPRAPREAARRYEWPCPGDLLHMDVKRYARFSRPGHAVNGDRHRTGAEKRAAVGYDYAHVIEDDHSRLV